MGEINGITVRTVIGSLKEGIGGWGHSFVVVMGSVESGGREGQHAGKLMLREQKVAALLL